MKYSGVVIISDLDGTLLNENRELAEENRTAILEFIEQGGQFGVATGRMEVTTLSNFPELPINIPSIFYNGALVYDVFKKQPVCQSYMPHGIEPIFDTILRKYPDVGVEINAFGKAYVIRSNDFTEIQLKREGIEGTPAAWSDLPELWYKVLVVGEHDSLVKVKQELDRFAHPGMEYVFSDSHILDIMSMGTSKGRALAALKDMHRDTWRCVVAIGDQENDIAMLETADFGVAVGNACKKAQSVSRYVIEKHSVPCIPQVLRILDKI